MQAYEVSVEGALTFENVGKYARILLDAINTYNEVSVDFSSCDSIDLTGAQLLISTAETARKRHVELRYQNAERYLRICEFAGLKPKGIGES